MASDDPRPDSTPAQIAAASSENDQPEAQSVSKSGHSALSRRSVLTVLGLGGLGVLSDSAHASHGGPHWRTDVDADGHTLFNLGTLGMATSDGIITDFEGANLTIDGTILTAENTHTNVSDGGTQVIANAADINFDSNLDVSDDKDGSVTVSASGGGGHTYKTHSLDSEGGEWEPITDLSEETLVEVTVDANGVQGSVNLYVDDVREAEIPGGSVTHRIVAPTSNVVLDASESISSNDAVGLHPDSAALEDFAFKGDGTILFMSGRSLPLVYSYTLSAAWELASATFHTALDVSGQDSFPLGLAFRDDGTEMYVSGMKNNSIYTYTLPTAWDLSTASLDSAFDVSSQSSFPEGLTFRDDGTRMFIADSADNNIYTYTLSRAWDISTATFDDSLDLSGLAGQPSGIAFNSDGTSLYVSDRQYADVYVFVLSTGWDISTATFEKESIDVASHESEPTGVSLHGDDTTLFVCGSESNAVFSFERIPLVGAAYASVKTT